MISGTIPSSISQLVKLQILYVHCVPSLPILYSTILTQIRMMLLQRSFKESHGRHNTRFEWCCGFDWFVRWLYFDDTLILTTQYWQTFWRLSTCIRMLFNNAFNGSVPDYELPLVENMYALTKIIAKYFMVTIILTPVLFLDRNLASNNFSGELPQIDILFPELLIACVYSWTFFYAWNILILTWSNEWN